ncbi:MAG: protein-glutamate O-methyltransferase CheR [Acidobacteriota bacterium]
MTVTASAFTTITELVRSRSGIAVAAGKEYLLQSRLQPLLHDHELANLEELATRLDRDPSGELSDSVVDAMTTNETLFFREPKQFTALRKEVIPKLVATGRAPRMKIWSAACSSGQEPYSLAMLLSECIPEITRRSGHVVATDISPTMVARTRDALYSQLEINRGLPPESLSRSFQREGARWRVAEPLRRLVESRVLNLVEPWSQLPTFDFIFLRNVLIYFDQDTKRDVLERVHAQLDPDGFLFLGGSESTVNLTDRFERLVLCGATVYRPRRGGGS